ncbi:GNAT family N-acetyltransferase [Alkalihalobacterium chitinilyticum]|uniref:GNAT family N-acetyltransferase n=1 Tax=Alkalihalobacterium chitinilyticum TaxID=2980103 RepID=A0ABT5VFR6_9BACI|nr:GNAT family N-acetyltransferase [Alkalihalobacterium chitinilyticum]MDE5414296.1 GNAT family N-acetyltransferase [Alkalihalobacterium chitinilyticum]
MLEAIAVHPDYQGYGIGKALMEKVHQISESDAMGTYLFTADKKNQQIYEYLGYKTVEECPSKVLTVYHMFRNND